MEIIYKIDGTNFTDYGVRVEGSQSTIGKLKLKEPARMDWKNTHGEMVDLSKKYYQARDITLECFIQADGPTDFITKFDAFAAKFDKAFTNRLSMMVEGNEPREYEVYLPDGIDMKKRWNAGSMVGVFTLALREPEPVKRVLKYTRTSAADKTVSITFTSPRVLQVYWGDGTHSFDQSGTAQTITHDYAANGTFYIVITGDIDAITSLTTTGTVVWNKLQ